MGGGYSLTRVERTPAGEIIEERRMWLNMSLEDVAKKSGLNVNTISGYEKNGIMSARLYNIVALCETLGLDVGKIISIERGENKRC